MLKVHVNSSESRIRPMSNNFFLFLRWCPPKLWDWALPSGNLFSPPELVRIVLSVLRDNSHWIFCRQDPASFEDFGPKTVRLISLSIVLLLIRLSGEFKSNLCPLPTRMEFWTNSVSFDHHRLISPSTNLNSRGFPQSPIVWPEPASASVSKTLQSDWPAAKLFPVLYGYLLAYLAGPGTFDSTHIIEFIGSLPEAVKYAGKTILAIPFAFHSINGIRHLSWDMGKCV